MNAEWFTFYILHSLHDSVFVFSFHYIFYDISLPPSHLNLLTFFKYALTFHLNNTHERMVTTERIAIRQHSIPSTVYRSSMLNLFQASWRKLKKKKEFWNLIASDIRNMLQLFEILNHSALRMIMFPKIEGLIAPGLLNLFLFAHEYTVFW